MTELTARIIWPNDEGFTPCSAEYRSLYDEKRAIEARNEGKSITCFPCEDYERWNALEDRMATLHASGEHLGKSVRY